MIKKRKTRDSAIDAVVYERTLKQAIARDKLDSDPFQWSFCIAQQQAVHKLHSKLYEKELLIRSRLIKAMSPQISAAAKLNVTIHYILGGSPQDGKPEQAIFTSVYPSIKAISMASYGLCNTNSSITLSSLGSTSRSAILRC